MSAPSFRAAGAGATGTGAVTPALPTGHAADDILLLVVQSSNQAITAPSGYSEIGSQAAKSIGSAAAAHSLRIGVFWKRDGGSESAPTVADTGDHTVAQILAFSGCVTSGNPWDVTGDGVCDIVTVSPSWQSVDPVGPVTTTQSDTFAVAILGHSIDSNAAQVSGWSADAIASFAELTGCDISTNLGTGGGFAVAGGTVASPTTIADRTSPVDITATFSVSSNYALMVIALKPPSAQVLTLTAAQGSFALTGKAATLSHNRSLAAAQAAFTLTGETASFSIRHTLTAAQGSFALTGEAATLSHNRTLAAAQATFTLTGETASFSTGHTITAAQGSFALTGENVSLSVTPGGEICKGAGMLLAITSLFTDCASQGISFAAGTVGFVLTGEAVALSHNRTFSVDSGSFTLTGEAASLTRQLYLTAAQGSFALTGEAASLARQLHLTAAQGSFALTGEAASLTRQFYLTASQGSYAFTGEAVALSHNRTFSVDTGSFTLTGEDASFTGQFHLAAAPGSFTLTGEDVSLSSSGVCKGAGMLLAITSLFTDCASAGGAQNLSLAAGTGSFVLTGEAATLYHNRSLTAAQATFTLTGEPASFSNGHILTAAQGSFVLTGEAAILSTSAVPTEVVVRGAGIGRWFVERNRRRQKGQTLRLLTKPARFALNRSSAALTSGRTLVAQSGGFAVFAGDSSVLRDSRLAPDTTLFVVSGIPAQFTVDPYLTDEEILAILLAA